MSLANTGPGFHDVGSYQMSGIPWTSGSIATTTTPQRIGFPRVTKFIRVFSRSGENRIGFSVNGINGSPTTNYYRIPSGSIQEFTLRVNEMYIRADAGTGEVDIMAGLTNIGRQMTGFLTGSTEFTGSSPGSGWIGVG